MLYAYPRAAGAGAHLSAEAGGWQTVAPIVQPTPIGVMLGHVGMVMTEEGRRNLAEAEGESGEMFGQEK